MKKLKQVNIVSNVQHVMLGKSLVAFRVRVWVEADVTCDWIEARHGGK